MAKFNVMQRRRRAQIAERKRAIHGDPTTGKLKNRPQPLSISGKRKRKLLKKWRRVHLSLSLSHCNFMLRLFFAFILPKIYNTKAGPYIKLVPWCCEWLLYLILCYCFFFFEKIRSRRMLQRRVQLAWKMLKWQHLKVLAHICYFFFFI